MPLKHNSSKKAFSQNVKAEMDSGMPQDQSLAVAYSVKRKAQRKKKASGGMVESGSKDMNYAEGGYINDQAKYEQRPMPSETDQDKAMVRRNSSIKPAKNDSWTDRSTVEQAQRPSKTPLSHPKIVKGSTFNTKLANQEMNLQSSASPGKYDEQPDKDYDEENIRHTSANPDMADSHSTGRKAYAKGGKVQESDYHSQVNKYEDDLTDLHPSEDEGSSMAHSENEVGQDRQGPAISDMEKPHNKYQRSVYADGGLVHEMGEQPKDEADEMHAASLAAAVMAEQRRNKQDSDSDIDHQMMMAEGGEILSDRDYSDIKSHGSMDSDDSDQADLSRNADEDANEEDQASYESLMRENYSESAGLDELDSPMDSAQHGDSRESDSENDHDEDIISEIRRNMRAKARR